MQISYSRNVFHALHCTRIKPKNVYVKGFGLEDYLLRAEMLIFPEKRALKKILKKNWNI